MQHEHGNRKTHGQRAAIQAAKLGKRVAVAERRNRLGGVSIHTGTIPSKTLRQATLEQLATRPLDVLDPTRVEETEQEAIQQLLDRAAAVVAAETAITREQFRRNRVGLLQGDASFVDANTVKLDGSDELVKAHKIVVAVGTRPARPATAFRRHYRQVRTMGRGRRTRAGAPARLAVRRPVRCAAAGHPAAFFVTGRMSRLFACKAD